MKISTPFDHHVGDILIQSKQKKCGKERKHIPFGEDTETSFSRIIDNKLIVNRRKIANEFIKYFVSLAYKINSTVTETGEIMVAKLELLRCYLSKSIE